jgi:hypothetical protein
MPTFDKKYSLISDPYKTTGNKSKEIKNIYWGEVISIEDNLDGGRIKVRLPDLDNRILNENLPWAYPMLPKFFHLYPKVGEVVRVFIEDVKYPQRSRYWMGSIISQLQKVEFDSLYTALSTTNIQFSAPEKAISLYPDAEGVFPKKEDVALIGRVNTDVILKENDVEIRAGKHENNDVLKLNKTNPASVRLTYETTGETTVSSQMIMADRIAIISHDGIPKYKAAQFTSDERQNVFDTGHPLGRGDVIVEALELLRKAIIQHIHGYPKLPADKSGVIIDLEKVDFSQILQRNIVIN